MPTFPLFISSAPSGNHLSSWKITWGLQPLVPRELRAQKELCANRCHPESVFSRYGLYRAAVRIRMTLGKQEACEPPGLER